MKACPFCGGEAKTIITGACAAAAALLAVLGHIF